MAQEDLKTITAKIHDISINSDDSTLKHFMQQAISTYNQKSKQSNILLLRDCVSAISALTLPTETEKLNRIAHILFATEDWGQNEDFSNRPQEAPKQIGDYGWPPEDLDQVLELPLLSRDCFNPPYSAEFSAMLVEEMVNVVFDGREEEKVIPRELIAFFSCVSGVFSLGYDRRGLCAFQAPIEEGGSREQVHQTLIGKNRIPISLSHEAPLLLELLDVLGGFRFGWSYMLCNLEPVDQWQSFYLYCSRKGDGDKGFDLDWRWRVVVYLDSDGGEGIVAPYKIFDTILGFLEWYGDWYDRLDLEQLLQDLMEDVEFD